MLKLLFSLVAVLGLSATASAQYGYYDYGFSYYYPTHNYSWYNGYAVPSTTPYPYNYQYNYGYRLPYYVQPVAPSYYRSYYYNGIRR